MPYPWAGGKQNDWHDLAMPEDLVLLLHFSSEKLKLKNFAYRGDSRLKDFNAIYDRVL